MEQILTGKQMKNVDSYAIEKIGIPSLVLMENAARAVVEKITTDGRNGKILILCGTGNNGADGLAVYRTLRNKGVSCDCYVEGHMEKATKEFLFQKEILDNLCYEILDRIEWERYEIFVDGIFGVGLSRDITGAYRTLIEELNRTEGYKYAIDIPSGIRAENGKICGVAVKADCTITFGYRKIGNVLYPGKDCSGEIMIADIGYPPDLPNLFCCQDYAVTKEVLQMIPKRPDYSNKGSFGKLLVIAGSKEYSGAAVLCAKAALKTGAGLVKVITHKENKTILYNHIPEVIADFYEEQDFCEKEFLDRELEKSILWADSVVIGPGLSENEYAEWILQRVLQKIEKKPLVIDASALNLLSKNEKLKAGLTPGMVITPHIGEMSRLTGKSIPEIQDDLRGTAVSVAEAYGVRVVLKDAVTVMADKEQVYYNTSGNNGMASGGSGDVLSGILGTILTWDMPEIYKVPLAVYIHGKCGDCAAIKYGMHGMTAMNIIEELQFLKKFE